MKAKKIVYFSLFFFLKFIEEKDGLIMNDIKKDMNEKNIDKFYKKYGKEISQTIKQEEAKDSDNSEKNEIKDNLLDDRIPIQVTKNFIIKGNDMAEAGLSEGSNLSNNDLIKSSNNISNSKESKPLNNEYILVQISKLSKEIRELKEKKRTIKEKNPKI